MDEGLEDRRGREWYIHTRYQQRRHWGHEVQLVGVDATLSWKTCVVVRQGKSRGFEGGLSTTDTPSKVSSQGQELIVGILARRRSSPKVVQHKQGRTL